jgi:hypothetical protein
VWEFVLTVLEVKLAGFLPLPRTNLLDLAKKVIIVQSDTVSHTVKLHKISSKLKSTNLRNETMKQEQDYPWRVVWDSAVEHTGDHH